MKGLELIRNLGDGMHHAAAHILPAQPPPTPPGPACVLVIHRRRARGRSGGDAARPARWRLAPSGLLRPTGAFSGCRWGSYVAFHARRIEEHGVT